jgi:hypothetical protein
LNGILITSVLILSYYIWYELAADLLFAFLLLIYFTLTQRKHFWLEPKSIIIAGITGGAAYLSKAIGFPFFLAHFTLLYLFEKKTEKKINLLILGLVIFFRKEFLGIELLFDQNN